MTANSSGESVKLILFAISSGCCCWCQRLHDIGKSGYGSIWLPILGWVALLIMLTDSGIGQNEYGTSEKYPDENDSDDDFFLGEEE